MKQRLFIQPFLNVVKHIWTSLFIVGVLLLVSFLLRLETPSGFVVKEDSVITPEVQEEAYYEGEVHVLVQLKDVDDEFFLYDNQEADVEEVKDFIQSDFVEKHDFESIDAFAGTITDEGLKKLEHHPNVESVQLDHVFSLELQDSVPLVNASRLHQTSTNITGSGIGVCVLDTGVNYNHVKLSDNYVTGYDYVNSDSDPLDDHGHGTHVSGIVEGVAPGVKLIHIKVLNGAGSGSESDIVAGINWCITNKNTYAIKAITMSLGAGLYSSYCDSSYPVLASAVNNAVNNSILVIASSGNDGSTTSISSPGCIQNVTSVGATDKNDALASYGNRNSLVDLVAPGSSINSTSSSGGYTTLSGTSMSAPHVAGAVVLIQQFSFMNNGTYLTPLDVESLFKNNAVDVSGYKRINVYAAVTKLDATLPSLLMYSPKSQSYPEGNITLNYSASDIFLERVYYTINGTNITVTNTTVLNVEGGSHTLRLSALDGNNNMNSTSVTFQVGLPTVTQYSPPHNYNFLNTSLLFNCSLSSAAGIVNLSLYHNLSGIFSINQTQLLNGTDGQYSFSLNASSNTSLLWNCLGYDVNGELDWGENRTVRVQRNTAPVIQTYSPNITNITLFEPLAQNFSLIVNDSENDAVSVQWIVGGSVQTSSLNYSLGGNYTSAGTYIVFVTAGDDYFANTSFSWNLTILNTEYCGDGVKNSTEQCEGSDFGGKSCASYGYTKGTLSCSSCIISSSGCSNSSSSGGSSGGGGGGGDQGSVESLEAFSDLQRREFSDDDLGEEVTLEETVPLEASSDETTTTEDVASPVVEETKKRDYSWVGGIVAALVGGGLLLLFVRREWRIIRNK